MGAENHYLNEDDDADILDAETNTTINEGDKSGRKRYVIRGPHGQALPKELQEALNEYIDTELSDVTVLSEAVPIEFRSTAWLLDFMADFTNIRIDGPMVLAMAEVLEEISDGRVSFLTRIYEAQRKIMWTQSIRRILNILLTGTTSFSRSAYAGEIAVFLDAYADMVNFVYNRAVEEYRNLCAKDGREVDEDFIQSGILSTRNNFQKMAFGYPLAQEEVA